MKKIAALVLAVAMALPFAACSKKVGGGGTTSAGVQTEENRSGGALEILEKVWDGYTADEKFPATGGYGKYMKDGRPGKIDAGDLRDLVGHAQDVLVGASEHEAAERQHQDHKVAASATGRLYRGCRLETAHDFTS